MQTQATERAADAALGIAAAGATTSWLATANEVVQLVAGVVAIISGSAAAYYYLKKSGALGEATNGQHDSDST